MIDMDDSDIYDIDLSVDSDSIEEIRMSMKILAKKPFTESYL